MTSEGYEAFDDPYLYKGTNTLKNRLGLRDPALLESFELEMTTSRAREPLPAGRYDTLHHRQVHRHLFQDVYRWAGKYRSVRIAKGRNLFCYPEQIEASMNRLFDSFHRNDCLGAKTAGDFVAGTTEFLGELNAIHPFREGNGRAQLAFMHLLGEQAGFPFDFSRVQRQSFLRAMIESFSGNLVLLNKELTRLLA